LEISLQNKSFGTILSFSFNLKLNKIISKVNYSA
jgi:hypothetical protein